MHDVTLEGGTREARSAAVDPVTGAATHVALSEFVEHRLRPDGPPVAVLFVDVDGLADVNRRFGFRAGDELLRRVADAARSIVASTAPELDAEALVARTGASEVGIAARGLRRPEVALLAGALKRAIGRLRTGDAPVTVSVGCAATPEDAASASDLLDAARDALRVAKAHGRNRVVVHDATVASNGSVARRALEQLLGMPASHALRFVYQPIVDGSRQVVASEALCRPQTSRFPGPAALFHEASRRDAVWALGRLVRSVATAPYLETPSEMPLFLNVHPHELTDPELLEPPPALARVASNIVLEIGECARLFDLAEIERTLAILRGRGFRIALDDLGAGYAGLGTLAALDLDYVKLDRGLVASVDRSSSVARLVERLVGYARERGITVVAEGVETTGQEAVLRAVGCDLFQGWLYGRGEDLPPIAGADA